MRFQMGTTRTDCSTHPSQGCPQTRGKVTRISFIQVHRCALVISATEWSLVSESAASVQDPGKLVRLVHLKVAGDNVRDIDVLKTGYAVDGATANDSW